MQPLRGLKTDLLFAAVFLTRHACPRSSSPLAAQDGNGWKVLEISFLVNQGSMLWIDAVDWLFLSLTLMLVYRSVAADASSGHGASPFPLHWARLGLVVAFFSGLDFLAECARFMAGWRAFSAMASVLSVLNTLLLLPAWLIYLGWDLPRARAQAFAGLASQEGGFGGGDGGGDGGVGGGGGGGGGGSTPPSPRGCGVELGPALAPKSFF